MPGHYVVHFFESGGFNFLIKMGEVPVPGGERMVCVFFLHVEFALVLVLQNANVVTQLA